MKVATRKKDDENMLFFSLETIQLFFITEYFGVEAVKKKNERKTFCSVYLELVEWITVNCKS